MNIIFDFGNVLVRWEPEKVFMPYFNNDDAKYWYFWRHVCDKSFRDRIDAGEDSLSVICERQQHYPEFAEAIKMYMDKWEESLPGEMPGMFDLVQRLKSDPNNHIYGLTNWSMETYPQARQKFKVLQLIDNYVVSGDVKVVKPDPRIFHILLDRYGLKSEECIFIDDNSDNVACACRLGLLGIVFHDAASLEATLNHIADKH